MCCLSWAKSDALQLYCPALSGESWKMWEHYVYTCMHMYVFAVFMYAYIYIHIYIYIYTQVARVPRLIQRRNQQEDIKTQTSGSPLSSNTFSTYKNTHVFTHVCFSKTFLHCKKVLEKMMVLAKPSCVARRFWKNDGFGKTFLHCQKVLEK